jgi:hypothetical protein
MFKTLQSKLNLIIFKNLVRTAKKTHPFTITKTKWLILFRETMAVYCEDHMKTDKYKIKSY